MAFAGMSDNQVMAAFYARDGTAFEEIQRRWGVRIYWYFYRRGWSHEDSEDLSQQTLLRVFLTKESGRGRYDPDLPFPPWTYRIAHNVAEDERRRREGRPPAVPLD